MRAPRQTRHLNVFTRHVTGDRGAVARPVATAMGIDDVKADALPERKMALVLAESGAGWRPLVVGDDIDDSLALNWRPPTSSCFPATSPASPP